MRTLLPTFDLQRWSTDYDTGIYIETLYKGWSLAIRWLGFTLEINVARAS